MRTLVALLLLGLAQATVAQSWPSKPIRLLVGYPPGGGADALARMVASRLSTELGQQVLVDNRPGAGATIAAAAAAGMAPDGYSLFFAESGLLIAPSIYAKLQFDAVKSFTPVSGAATTPLVLVVNPDLKANNVQELIALLKADPGRQAYGSPGVGTVHHLAMELFQVRAGVQMVHIPYKGASAIIPDLISGQIRIGVLSAPPALAQSKDGRLRPLALTSPAKVAGANWPALADTLPGFDASPRLFVVGPAGLPENVVSRLNQVMKSILGSRELLEAFAAQGASADWTTPQELGARMAEERKRWAEIAARAGIKAE